MIWIQGKSFILVPNQFLQFINLVLQFILLIIKLSLLLPQLDNLVFQFLHELVSFVFISFAFRPELLQSNYKLFIVIFKLNKLINHQLFFLVCIFQFCF